MGDESVVLSDNVAKLLAELGHTPDEVATSLRAASVQGIRNAARYLNPIVRWVIGRTQTKPFDVDVMRGDRLGVRLPDGSRVEVALPAAVLQFIAAFDQGRYPELEMPTAGLVTAQAQE